MDKGIEKLPLVDEGPDTIKDFNDPEELKQEIQDCLIGAANLIESGDCSELHVFGHKMALLYDRSSRVLAAPLMNITLVTLTKMDEINGNNQRIAKRAKSYLINLSKQDIDAMVMRMGGPAPN